MPYSQNGFSANDRSVIGQYSLPGGTVALRKGDVSVVLLWCANRWHATVEPLRWPGIWGYAERTVRGSSTQLSNHASGTAIDLNAPAHPLGTSPRANFTAGQIGAIHSITAYCEGVVRWGGDYTGRKDGMHLEVNAGAAAVARIANKIRAASTPQPAAPKPREDDAMFLAMGKNPPSRVGLLSGGLFREMSAGELAMARDTVERQGAPRLYVDQATWDWYVAATKKLLGT